MLMLLFLRLWLLLSFLSLDLSTWRGVVPNEPNLFPFQFEKLLCRRVLFPSVLFSAGADVFEPAFLFLAFNYRGMFLFLAHVPMFFIHSGAYCPFVTFWCALFHFVVSSPDFCLLFSSSIAWAKQRGSHVVGGERSVLFPTFSMSSFQWSTASSSSTSAVISCWYPSLPRSHAVDGATFYF